MKSIFAKNAMLLAALCLMSLSAAFAQIRVSETVYDNNGEALAGAGVVEKGATNGTVTDLDGRCQLTAREGASLEVSFIGFAWTLRRDACPTTPQADLIDTAWDVFSVNVKKLTSKTWAEGESLDRLVELVEIVCALPFNIVTVLPLIILAELL